MTARDYPVTFGYGEKTTINGKPYTHRGNDRRTPTGTPVVIGSTTIGLTGNTGLSTGPHLHTQAGTDAAVQNTTDPTGHEFKGGVVTSTRTTDSGAWGKYVTIKTGKMYVTYAHLSKVNVKVGDKVGEMTDAEINKAYKIGGYGKNAPAKDRAHWKNSTLSKMLEAIWNSDWNHETRDKANKYDAMYKSKEYYKKKSRDLAADNKDLDATIAKQEKEIESLKAQVGENSKWETFKALIRELIK